MATIAEVVESGTISQLPERVRSLPGRERQVFDNVLRVFEGTSQIYSPTMALGELQSQKIIKIINPWEHIVNKINEARARRPQATIDPSVVEREIEETRGKDFFCPGNYETKTPEHSFGRIRGADCVTAANLYSGSPWHAVIIFGEHSPLVVPTTEQVLDRLYVTDEFARAANKVDENAIYTSFMQNSMDQGGASILHGHAQVQQEIGCHEGMMEALFDVHHRYGERFGGRNYFDDHFSAHRAVGIGVEKNGVMVTASLTGLKEDYVRMVAYSFDEPQRVVVAEVLRYFMSSEGFNEKAFNFVIGYRPISWDGKDWSGFPAIVAELISRGDITKKNNNIAASEYGLRSPFIAKDPYLVNEGIKKALVL